MGSSLQRTRDKFLVLMLATLMVAIKTKVNQFVKQMYVHGCPEGFYVWNCTFDNEMVYFLQPNSLTCPLKTGLSVASCTFFLRPFYICTKQAVVVITILVL